MSEAGDDTLLFEAVIVPHRSLSPRGMRRLLAALVACVTAGSSVFWWLGAWPVMGFGGLELGLAAWLLRRNARDVRQSEIVLLTAQSLRIIRTDRHQGRTESSLQPAWLQVVLVERPGRVPGLFLASHGVSEEIARQLGEAEKRDLAGALRGALHRWRNPVFDNPQLDS
jgi:uncharacterized membrane protein